MNAESTALKLSTLHDSHVIRPFVGAYWSQRKESRSECAARVVKLLDDISFEPSLQTWFLKAKSEKQAKASRIDKSASAIESLLQTNDRDTDGEPIPDLGFSFSVWNGDRVGSVSLDVHCGAYSKFAGNYALLKFSARTIADEDRVRFESLLKIFVSVWEPDNAIVSSTEDLAGAPGKKPWDKSSWFTCRYRNKEWEFDAKH